jgi:hypothetical protein
MAADVEERAELSLPVAEDQDGYVAGARRVKRAGLGDLVDAADVLPVTAEDAFVLELQRGCIGVPAPRERPGLRRAQGALLTRRTLPPGTAAVCGIGLIAAESRLRGPG